MALALMLLLPDLHFLHGKRLSEVKMGVHEGPTVSGVGCLLRLSGKVSSAGDETRRGIGT